MAAMTADEKRRMERLENLVMEMSERVIQIENKVSGIMDMSARVVKIENKVSGIMRVSVGIAIGIAVAAVLFGWLSIKQFVELVK